MAKAQFVRHPSISLQNTSPKGNGAIWKLDVRAWAFANATVRDVDPGLSPTSNNPTVVTDHYQRKPDSIKGTMEPGKAEMTVRFYARATGFSFIHLFDKNPGIAVSDVLQVQVKDRHAAKLKDISLTTLSGKTCAINAPDAQSYTMDTTLTFDDGITDPAAIFARVPSGLDHLVISSHAIVLGNNENIRDLSLFVCGTRKPASRLHTDQVTAAFAPLKGKFAVGGGVIWIGSCSIGENAAFCEAAARATERPVVAPAKKVTGKKFEAGKVDMIDGYGAPKVFVPDNGKVTRVHMTDFCASQDLYKFTVPA